jgi:hypothetical protein
MRELTDVELDAVGGGGVSGGGLLTIENVGNVHLDLANVVQFNVANQVAVSVLSAGK